MDKGPHTFRITIIKKTRTASFVGEKETLVHCWWACKLVQPLWKIVRIFLKILKIELPYIPVVPLLVIYLQKMKTLIWKDICTTTFITTFKKTVEIWKQPKQLINVWIKKMCHKWGHIRGHHAEWNKWSRVRQIPYNFTYI